MMANSLLQITFFLLICSAISADSKLIQKVTIKKFDGTSPLPRNPDSEQCGGPGEFLELRSSHCNPIDDVCKVPAGKELVAEIDFIPVRDMNSLEVKGYIGVDDAPLRFSYEEKIPNSAVQIGVRYTITVSREVDPSLKGKQVKAVFHLHDSADKSLRICVESIALVV